MRGLKAAWRAMLKADLIRERWSSLCLISTTVPEMSMQTQ
jgi:hypothetical protein